MRIGSRVTVTRKMFRAREHAARPQSANRRTPHASNEFSVGPKAAFARDRTLGLNVQIEHRRKIQIRTRGPHLTPDRRSDLFDERGIADASELRRARPDRE